jgi:hypothetical protein
MNQIVTNEDTLKAPDSARTTVLCSPNTAIQPCRST